MIKEEVLASFLRKNVLITGGTGLIGRQIVEMLCDAGASVRIASLDNLCVNKRAEHVLADLTDFSLCNELAKDMDYVFHLAGIKGSIDVTMSKPASFFVPLLMMNTNMLEASRLNKVRKLVYTSSIGAYPSAEVFFESQGNDGPPMDMFPGWAKRMAEMQIEAYKIQYGIEHFSVVRPCNVYGPGDNFDPQNAMVIPTIIARIFNKENPVNVWGDGSALRDFAFSRDCAEGVILALYHGTKEYPFLNLGSGVGCSIRALLETLNSFLDFNFIFDTTKPSGFPRRVMDISLSRKVIDYNPTTSLHDGLKETWEWYLSNKDEYLLKKNYFKIDDQTEIMKILFVIYQLMYADCSALGYLSAIARQLGHRTFFCSLDRDDLLFTIDNLKPDVVGYSATVLGYNDMVRLNHEAKERYNFAAIMGGAHSTFSSETFEESGMDAFCIGEGDYAFRDFLIKLANGESYDDVENLVTRKKRNPVRPLITNLDELPMPDRDLTLANSYLRDTPKKTFFATRGCPFECAYCCNNYYHRLYKGKGSYVRRFSVDRIIREIEYVGQEYRMDFVKFGDDLFAAKADDWLVEFAEQYPQRIGRPFNCYLRLDTVTDSLLKLLQKAGCYSVSVSIDSTSQHVREKVLKRKFKSVDIREQLKKIRSYGIGVWANFMSAVPESTIEDEFDTIRLSKDAGLLFPAYSTTVPMKGTELYDYSVSEKYIDPGNHNYDMSGCYERSTLLCFSEKEKDIRYNVFLLGGIISKLPSPFNDIAIQIIKVVPPNMLFKKIHYLFDYYYLTRQIFNFKKDAIGVGREYNKNRFLFLKKGKQQALWVSIKRNILIKEIMNILFCIYQLDFADHIAIPHLSAVAKKLGHSTDLCIIKDNDLVETVARLKPDVVAYSSNILGFREMVADHKKAKRNHSFVSIMGGPQATFSPHTFEEAGVDAYCVGEGELAFSEFLIRLEQGKTYDDVLNIITKSAKNPVRPLIADLSVLLMPDRDITMLHTFLKHTSKKTFYTSRGCPFQCHYCANSYYKKLYRGKGPTVRRFAVEQVLQEIEHVKASYRTDFVKFGDDVFAMFADDWLDEFANNYSKRIGIPFNCFLRFDTVDAKLLQLLKHAGCHSVHLSVDSTSEHVREKIFGRNMRKIDITAKLKLIHSYGIKTWVNFMLAAPESTLEDDLESIRLSKKGKVAYTNYSTTVPMRGTILFDYCVDHGLVDFDTHISDMQGCIMPTTLKCFSQKERDIRYNIFLLGPIVSRFPFLFDWIGKQIIRIVPPNALFLKIHKYYYDYSIQNRIFALRRNPDK